MKLSPQVKAVFYMIVIMWLIFAADQLLPYDFTQFGIEPRTKKGLIGIIFAPFLHDSLQNIAYETIPLFILSMVLAVSYPKRAIMSWLLIYITSGAIVWLFTRKIVVYTGSSYLILGLIGFLIIYGFSRRSVGSILISTGILALYIAYLYGIIPKSERYPWESHVFGLLSGAFWGYIFGKKDRQKVLLRKAGVIRKEDKNDDNEQQ